MMSHDEIVKICEKLGIADFSGAPVDLPGGLGLVILKLIDRIEELESNDRILDKILKTDRVVKIEIEKIGDQSVTRIESA